MQRRILLLAGLVLGAASLGAQQPTATAKQAPKISKEETALRAQAKVSEDAAKAAALAAVPGATVKSSELEREKGKLIWSFDLAAPGKKGVEEVHVDAMTGKVIAREHEDAKAERAEAKAEKAEKKTNTSPKKP